MIFFIKTCCGYPYELHRLVDAIQISTDNMCLYKEVDIKCTGYDLKTLELPDCALIGACTVINSNTVSVFLIQISVCTFNIPFKFIVCLVLRSIKHY